MVRRILWIATALVPIAIILSLLGVGDVALFVLSALALVPLAYVIGESTEQVGEHTGPVIAGLLNASFGNAPELLVALFAVHDGLFTVVRASLVGSVVSNLLLVLGTALVFGGRGRLGRRSVFGSLGQVALAAALFAIPSLVHRTGTSPQQFLWLTVPIAVILLAIYVTLTTTQIRTELRAQRKHRSAPAEGAWSLARGLATLAAATVATVAVTDMLTGSITAFADRTGLGTFFTSAVIVAIVGNAAEHGGAVVIAARGNVRLASEIALSSSAQVATFVIPAVALISIGLRPLPLTFRPVEFLGLTVAVLIPALLLMSGRARRSSGWVLLAGYLGIAVVFFAAG